MTFEKEFPSLKGKRRDPNAWHNGVISLDYEDDGNVVECSDIQENCLDKAKVKKVLNNCVYEGDVDATYDDVEVMLKKLGSW